MKIKISRVLGTLLSILIKVAIAVWIVNFIYSKTVWAYDFGYRVFTENAIADAPGRDVTVSVTEGKSYMEIANILEEKGLVRDANLAFCQILLSEYREKLQPGVYILNTSMKTEEMLKMMATQEEEKED